jgi:Fic family protein
LTLGETEEAIGRGHVESESPDRRAAVNLQETYLWVIAHASTYEAHPEVFIRGINQMLLKGAHDNAGQYRDGQVRISGLAWSPPMPTSVGPLMGALAEELARGPNNRSVLEFAATVHTKLVTIHPFFDGNGRTARLLVNAVLVRFGWPAITVRFDDRDRYLLALEKSNKGNIGELITLFIGLCKSELDDIVKESLSASKGNSSGAGKAYAAKEDHVSPEQIRKRARQINLGDFDDPLAEVLRLKEDAERSLLTE